MFKKLWQKLNDETIGTARYFRLSVSHYALFTAVRALIAAHARGKILDAGAGRLAWRPYLAPAGTDYVSVDKYRGHPDLSLQSDIGALPFPDGSFDTVFCSQVLEHTTDPSAIVRELSRVLKKDGRLILTAPHLSYVHGEPEDYFRFTRYGLAHLCSSAGLEPIAFSATGGLLLFVMTIPSVVLLSFAYPLRPLRPLVFALNTAFVRACCFLDALLNTAGLYPLDVAVVARKKAVNRDKDDTV